MPGPYGSQDNPYVEFPFDRIVDVHWKTTETWAGQVNYSLAIPIGTTDGTTPPMYLDPSSNPGAVFDRGLVIPPRGTFSVALQVCATNTVGFTNVHAELLYNGSPVDPPTTSDSSALQQVNVCNTVNTGVRYPAGGGGRLTVMVSGTSGGADGMIPDPASHFSVNWTG